MNTTRREQFRNELKTTMDAMGDNWYSLEGIIKTDELAEKYSLNEFEVNEEVSFYEANRLVENKECKTLDEAFEKLSNPNLELLEQLVRNSSKEWLREDTQTSNNSNNNSNSTNSSNSTSTIAQIIQVLIPIAIKAGVSRGFVTHFIGHVCLPDIAFNPNKEYMAKTGWYDAKPRLLLPPFGDTPESSFLGYIKYTKDFVSEHQCHCLDIDSREIKYFNNSLFNNSKLNSFVGLYKTICYSGKHSNSGVVKITKKSLAYDGGSFDALCYIVYDANYKNVISCGRLAKTSSERDYLLASTTSRVNDTEYDNNYDSNFNVEYYICKIRREQDKEDKNKFKYLFTYEIRNGNAKEIIDRYKKQTTRNIEIIYVINNSLVKPLYYLEQSSTKKLFDDFKIMYNDINLSKFHTPIDVQSRNDAIKVLNDLDDEE